jgi:tetratricopeptide (TPR) repeat protein
VALALVYDQKLPPYWPHRQVDQKLVPFHEESIVDRFNYWVQSNESRALLLDLRRLTPSQLKFVVDAPIDESEFDWIRKNVKLNRTDFAKAFSSVGYDHARYQAGNYVWKGEPYTMLNIRQRGGICVDQAYYSMVAGKAKGLPTLFFTGQGNDGGHAWFGYMKADDRWELDCGRYLNQNYAIGEALDPQTWQVISDHDLEFLAQRFREKLEFAASQDDILMAQNFEKQGDAARALKAYDSAISVCPKNIDAWDAKAEYLDRTHAPAEQRRAHYDAAAKQFVTDRDIKSRQLQSLAAVLRELGDGQGATALERQIVSQNKRKRSDLSVNVVAQQLGGLIAEKKYEDAFKAYRQQLMALAKTGGGNFFNDVVTPFVEALVDAGDPKRAKDALDLASKALHPEPNSILEREFKELEAEIKGDPKK